MNHQSQRVALGSATALAPPDALAAYRIRAGTVLLLHYLRLQARAALADRPSRNRPKEGGAQREAP